LVPEGVLFITPSEMKAGTRIRSLLVELIQPEYESDVTQFDTLYTMKDGCINAALQFAPFYVSSDPREPPDGVRDPVIYFG